MEITCKYDRLTKEIILFIGFCGTFVYNSLEPS
jgi:hypothetical protein